MFNRVCNQYFETKHKYKFLTQKSVLIKSDLNIIKNKLKKLININNVLNNKQHQLESLNTLHVFYFAKVKKFFGY